MLADLGLRNVEADEGLRIDRGAELIDRDAAGEVSGGRREEIAAVEGAGDAVECEIRVGQLVRGGDSAGSFRGRDQQAVVGADEQAAVARGERERPTVAADARVDHGEVDSLGHVRERVAKDERTLENVLRRDAVRDVDDLRVGCDPLDHAVAGSDEVVSEPEVGQEGDEHGAMLNAAGGFRDRGD